MIFYFFFFDISGYRAIKVKFMKNSDITILAKMLIDSKSRVN